MRRLLEAISATGAGSFLAVLKRMGPSSFGMLSFPMEGYTLALDFPATPANLALLETLDIITADHGGRIYLTNGCASLAADVRARLSQAARVSGLARALRSRSAHFFPALATIRSVNMLASPVLILGARSDIGRALARGYAAQGCEVILAARGDISADSTDLALRTGARVHAVSFDVTDGQPDAFFDALGVVPGTVVMVAGLLEDQAQSAADDLAAACVMDSNYAGPSRYLLAAARRMANVPGACIIGISSVAGERGRASNFVYGSAKAGFTAFLSGRRNAYAMTGLHVMTVKPGFVRTQMTAGMKLPPAVTAEPQQVSDAIIRAQGRKSDVIYTLARRRLNMAIIRAIPEPIFKKLSL
ncbi:SDR family NAD(P)-dependent oxidoreductase [Blastomonas fulva]|uniref:SDR family NAD(P)-dependent oxidoreductase n=1 Tax=Blastomonas fulva TaxID=1550728 RepID=UPI003F6EFC87